MLWTCKVMKNSLFLSKGGMERILEQMIPPHPFARWLILPFPPPSLCTVSFFLLLWLRICLLHTCGRGMNRRGVWTILLQTDWRHQQNRRHAWSTTQNKPGQTTTTALRLGQAEEYTAASPSWSSPERGRKRRRFWKCPPSPSTISAAAHPAQRPKINKSAPLIQGTQVSGHRIIVGLISKKNACKTTDSISIRIHYSRERKGPAKDLGEGTTWSVNQLKPDYVETDNVFLFFFKHYGKRHSVFLAWCLL